MGFRQRYAYIVIVMLLILAAAAGATGPQPTTEGITGAYFCEGTNSDGSSYHGVVTIARRADAYYLRWELQRGITAFGVGLREGNTLGVSYYGPNTGVIVYRIQGNRLIGRWTVPGADGLASETLMPLDQAPIRPPSQSPAAPGVGLPIRL